VARLTRLCIAGLPHHVLQCGVGGQPVFRDEQDCVRYMELLRAAAAAQGLAVHAYLLLPTAVHLLATPASGQAIGHAVQAIARRYVREYNLRHGRSGSVFEARYRAAVVQPDHHLLASMRYIEGRPVALGLGEDPAEYRWSSFRHHAGLAVEPFINDHPVYWALGNTPFERHAAYVRYTREQGLTSEDVALERAVRGGWAFGDVQFAQGLGAQQRPAIPRAPGRPRKTPDMPPIKKP
jgi:putative transposase